MNTTPPNVEKIAHELFGKTLTDLIDDRFPKDCFCRDDTADIFSVKVDLMGEPVATLQVFMNDKSELELFMDADHSDVVLMKKCAPIHFCPFCGRFLSGKEKTTHDS